MYIYYVGMQNTLGPVKIHIPQDWCLYYSKFKKNLPVKTKKENMKCKCCCLQVYEGRARGVVKGEDESLVAIKTLLANDFQNK